MSEVPVLTKHDPKRKRQSLDQAKSESVENIEVPTEDEMEIAVDMVDVPSITDIPEDEDIIVEHKLIGYDPKRKTYRFISPVPSLIIMFRIPRLDRNGEFVLTSLGEKVYDEFDAKFRNGMLMATPAMAKLLMAHKSYGGQAETITQNADPLFYLDNYPQHEWKIIKERERFITKEEKAYEE